MLLTMEEIKAQLRLDEDFDTDDRHLQLLACAAQKRTETYLNRKLYAPDETIPDSDPDAVTEVEKLDMPQSFGWLVGPYRYFPQ
ncbi:head-tail connector protein [Escherichia coli]|uniref:head-tail connector protein n=1 Tax=Escherichia coli TaxID=562 RepID=UPI002882EC38|nr:head-tail connector protein [Escherichia coli]